MERKQDSQRFDCWCFAACRNTATWQTHWAKVRKLPTYVDHITDSAATLSSPCLIGSKSPLSKSKTYRSWY
eukprot:5221962-Amphidinium_carterae.1